MCDQLGLSHTAALAEVKRRGGQLAAVLVLERLPESLLLLREKTGLGMLDVVPFSMKTDHKPKQAESVFCAEGITYSDAAAVLITKTRPCEQLLYKYAASRLQRELDESFSEQQLQKKLTQQKTFNEQVRKACDGSGKPPAGNLASFTEYCESSKLDNIPWVQLLQEKYRAC